MRPVVEIARHLRGRLPLAIATGSTTESASTSLEAIGVLHWFDTVVSSEELGMAKPTPDVFLAATRMTAVDAGPWRPR